MSSPQSSSTENEARPSGSTLRLFIAIELPDDLRDALAAAIDLLQHAGDTSALRWVRPEGIHLTLKFLGPVPASRVELINTVLRFAVRDAASLALRPEGFGAFHGGRHMVGRGDWQREPRRHNIRVVWVGFGGDATALTDLTTRVETAIAPLGFPTEKRAFFPHLTLARARESSTREEREALWSALEPYLSKSTRTGNFRRELVPTLPVFHVKQLSLMQSTLGPSGAVYRTVATFPLEGGGA